MVGGFNTLLSITNKTARHKISRYGGPEKYSKQTRSNRHTHKEYSCGYKLFLSAHGTFSN